MKVASLARIPRHSPWFWTVCLASSVLPIACQSTTVEDPAPIEATSPVDQDLEELAQIMAGHFSSRAQSEADEDFFAIQMILAPIWAERTDGHWLYVEQATEARPDAPYRQRVYQVTREAGRLVSHVYEFPGDPKDFVGAHAHPEKLAGVQPEDLVLRKGCSVYLERVGPESFSGGTEGTGCTSDWGEAKYVTSEVQVDASGIRSWDRGFLESGEQAWGAVSGPYLFDRQ